MSAEPYIDVGIICHQDADLFLLVKQCFNIKNDKTVNNISVCCGVLSYKLKSNTSAFIGGKYYTEKEFNISCKAEKDIMIFNKCIERFTANAISLGAQQVDEEDKSFTAILEQDMVNRLTETIPKGVVVKEI
ncbi:unnamed protein product [Rotaria magnacalcarata]|uniref:Uncharacterized protein n=1 Tax=Rotaria magnacalcarata TaxID=392030 RepID=A0A8S3IUY0_9BILA|nr:unnamed protein product [Rotaria magnacalcarata]CAF5204699.1 unnamed protein product [Rotaria magnacalcarata]